MELAGKFAPLASSVGLLAMITLFFIYVTMFSLGAAAVFFLATRSSVAPEHRTSMVLSAVICGVAAFSYFLIRDLYEHQLHALAPIDDPAARLDLIRDGYQAIGQYRYMDWAVTTPLLLVKIVLVLKVKPHEIKRALAALLAADFWMIVAGYIGEQQLGPDATVLVGPHLLWGALSTLGYLLIPIVLYRIGRRFRARATPEEWHAFQLSALSIVTTWGVYPIGYTLNALLPTLNLNWLHIAFSIADVINKVGVGVVIYLAAAHVLEQRVPKDATEPAHLVG